MRAPSGTHGKAKALRARMSLPEVLLWVRRRSPETPTFRRQHPVGPYILDFYCSAANLGIEIDGQSHSMGDRPERDLRRAKYLAAEGIRMIHYPAIDVLRDPDEVAYSIFLMASAPPQSSDLIGPLTAPP